MSGEVGVRCGQCGATLREDPSTPADERRPCPKCGSLSRQFAVHLASTVSLRSSLELARIRELYERDRRWQAVATALIVVPSLLGYFVGGWIGVLIGLVFGVVGLWVGPRGSLKVREIERRRA